MDVNILSKCMSIHQFLKNTKNWDTWKICCCFNILKFKQSGFIIEQMCLNDAEGVQTV